MCGVLSFLTSPVAGLHATASLQVQLGWLSPLLCLCSLVPPSHALNEEMRTRWQERWDKRAGFPRSAPPAGLCVTAGTRGRGTDGGGPHPSAAVLPQAVQTSGPSAPLQDSQALRGAPGPTPAPTSFPPGHQLLPQAGVPAPVRAIPVLWWLLKLFSRPTTGGAWPIIPFT